MTIDLSDIRIRPYTSSDIPIVPEKHVELYKEDHNYPPDTFGKYVNDALADLPLSGGPLWIAEYEHSPASSSEPDPIWAGCVSIIPTDEPTGRLRFLLVAPAFRSCGLGRRLMEVALDYCLSRNFRKVTLSTAADCVSAHKLYRHFGFQRVKTVEGTPWGGGIHEWWEKEMI